MMTRPTRRAVLAAMIAAPGLIAVAAPALAESTADAAPLQMVIIPTAGGSRYTSVKFTNLGPGVAKIEAACGSFNDVFTIEEGAVVKITKIFGTKKCQITNRSTTATVRIDSRWL